MVAYRKIINEPLKPLLADLKCDTLYFTELQTIHLLSAFNQVKVLFKYIFFLRKLKPDILIPYTDPINVITNLIWRFTGAKKCLFTMRRGYREVEPMSFYEKILRFFSPVYVANSIHGARELEIKFKLKPYTVKTVLNGVILKPITKTRTEWRTLLSISENDFVFIMVANFYNEKKQDTLIKSFSKICKEASSPYKLILVGSPPQYDRNYHYAKSLAFDSKLCEQIKFIEESNDISGLLCASDVAVLLTLSEGCPNSLIEYVLAKKPIIASNIEACTEVLGRDYPGLVNPDSVEEVYMMMERTIRDTVKFTKATEAIYERVSEIYSEEKMIKLYEKLLFTSH